jgi:hypothetical protein
MKLQFVYAHNFLAKSTRKNENYGFQYLDNMMNNKNVVAINRIWCTTQMPLKKKLKLKSYI